MPEFDSTISYREIPGYPGYKVGSDGTVWSCWARPSGRRKSHLTESWKQLRQSLTSHSKPYFYVNIKRGGGRLVPITVHILVASAFIGPCPAGEECRHKNGNGLDNRPSNIEYGTKKQNGEDRVRHGTNNPGEKAKWAKLTEVEVLLIRELIAQGVGSAALSWQFDISQPTICDIASRRTWKHI